MDQVIGIDLGTTNSAVAYVEPRPGGDPLSPALRVFEVPQLVAPGDVQSRPVLPSFLYLADAHERVGGALGAAVGRGRGSRRRLRARSRGAGAGAAGGVREVVAGLRRRRSHGTHPAVRARARRCGPSRRSRPRHATWRTCATRGTPRGPAATPTCASRHKPIVLTVPASFDEEARELTIAAATEAGLAEPHADRRTACGALRVDRRQPSIPGRLPGGRRPGPRVRRRRRHDRLQPDSRVTR